MLFLDFRNQLKGEGRTVNGILSGVRGFLQFLLRQGHLADNPLEHIPPRAENAFIPFVFSPQNKTRKVYLKLLVLSRHGH